MAPDGADLPVRHVLRAAARRARARRRAVRIVFARATSSSSRSSRRCISMAVCADRDLAVARATSRSPGTSAKARPIPAALTIATSLKALIPIGFALLFLQSLSRGDPKLSRAGGERMMPFNEMLAILMLVSFFVLLLAGIPVALTLATSGFVFGYLGFGTLLFNLLPQPHLRRGDQLHAARDPAVRVHGHDAGEIAAGRRPDGRDRRMSPARCAAGSASASSWSAC